MKIINYHKSRFTGHLARGLFTFAVFALTPLLAHGATYYVGKAGRDSNSCAQASSQQTPKLTVTAGISCMNGGDTLIIQDGVYPEGPITTIPAGSPGAPTIVKAQNRNKAIIRPTGLAAFWVHTSHVTIDGIDADCINAYGVCGPYLFNNSYDPPSHITLQHGTARNAKGTYGSGIEMGPGGHQLIWDMDVINNGTDEQYDHGIYLYGSNVIIDGNRVRGSAGWGIHLYHGCDGKNGCPSEGIIIRNNTVYSQANRSGIIITQATGALVYNNVVYGNGASGVELYGGDLLDTKIFNNTIYGNGSYCVAIPDSGSWNTQVRNNICYRNSSNSIFDQGVSTITSNNLMTDASFANAPAGDFHILAGSPAIGGGTNLYGTFNADFDGRSRAASSAWDRGAFVFSGAAGGPAAPAAPANLRLVSFTN